MTSRWSGHHAVRQSWPRRSTYAQARPVVLPHPGCVQGLSPAWSTRAAVPRSDPTPGMVRGCLDLLHEAMTMTLAPVRDLTRCLHRAVEAAARERARSEEHTSELQS